MDYSILEDNVRYTYANVVWSHKIQEKQADIFSNRYKVLTTIEIIAVSLTSVGILSIIFTDPVWLRLVAALISVVSLFLCIYLRSFDLQKMISDHKETANKLLSARNKLQVLLLKIRMEIEEVNNLLEDYECLVNEINDIYKNAPVTTDKAVKMAKDALELKQDDTYTDIEIDQYLPEGLKKEKKHG